MMVSRCYGLLAYCIALCAAGVLVSACRDVPASRGEALRRTEGSGNISKSGSKERLACLSIWVDPQYGLSIHIDEQKIATQAPVHVFLKKGQHHLRIVAPGYKELRMHFNMTQPKDLKLKLELRPQKISFTANRKGYHLQESVPTCCQY
jgi:hypothetical protein